MGWITPHKDSVLPILLRIAGPARARALRRGVCLATDISTYRVVLEAAGLAPTPHELEIHGFMQIIVRDNNVDQALRALKKKLQREGVYREMKLRRHYEKPSEKRARERAAAIRRARKLERKRLERDGIR